MTDPTERNDAETIRDEPCGAARGIFVTGHTLWLIGWVVLFIVCYLVGIIP